MSDGFAFPVIWNYPPYFTLQPVAETQQRQRALWTDLILRYCRHHRVFVVSAEDGDESPLFYNRAINRKLNREAKLVFLEDLVKQGSAQWLDKERRSCLVLWKSIPDWADAIAQWAAATGQSEGVVLLSELQHGDDVRGTELEGLPRDVLLRALRALEQRGRARLFKGAAPDEEGVKFSV